MPVAVSERNTSLLPPDEKFWKRYSPHQEFPLAGMTSIFVHALVVGVLLLGGFLLIGWRESDKPVRMDNVVLAGPGFGSDGAGSPPGGEDGTELKEKSKSNNTEYPLDPKQKLNEAPVMDLNVPAPLTLPIDDGTDILAELAKIGKEAAKQGEETKQPPKSDGPAKSPGKDKGKGLGGSGDGPGKGIKDKGPGVGGPGGKATKQQIYANRWRFDLSGNAKEHAKKLEMVGVTVGYHSGGRFLVVQDLSRRPVRSKADNPNKYFGVAVIWENRTAQSVQPLAKELGLGAAPPAVFMMLPKDREEKMAEAEAEYAQSQGRNPDFIQVTTFDFRLRDGIYEPVVVDQK